MTERRFWVYILASDSKTLYIGVTGNLERRIFEHKQKVVPGFTARYGVSRLVYYAETNDPREAITYEKTLKGKSRAKKVALI
ncbi:GIY-YIG nuclease family protein [bacterium]|nr:MAG: GIY-YIG nuclease family protein [bacterium]